MNYTIDLGSNIVRDCEAALIIEGVEVFRLRERAGDDQLVVDFEIRNERDERLAVIAKNNVVHAAPGFDAKSLAKESFVRDASGKIYARVIEVGSRHLKIEGDFWVNGHHVVVLANKVLNGTMVMSGNVVIGCGKAIEISRDALVLGGG